MKKNKTYILGILIFALFLVIAFAAAPQSVKAAQACGDVTDSFNDYDIYLHGKGPETRPAGYWNCCGNGMYCDAGGYYLDDATATKLC
ncbi:MAG: hypothetical protein NTW46_02715, partial [Candidatus Nealsonbacteria bacterium]|nr:hypothetical protein [Candidatus Nealsonbacteria bacterium]